MSHFACEHCGATCIDTQYGYIQGCEHHPPERFSISFIIDTRGMCGNLAVETEKDLIRQGAITDENGKLLGKVSSENNGRGRLRYTQKFGD